LRHPAELGAAEVAEFLSSLAVERRVSASTQNQALSALLFLYREVLGIRSGWLLDVVRARRTLVRAIDCFVEVDRQSRGIHRRLYN